VVRILYFSVFLFATAQASQELDLKLFSLAASGSRSQIEAALGEGARACWSNRDYLGQTALHQALTNPDLEVFKTLLERCADPNVANVLGQSALLLAIQQANWAQCRQLLGDMRVNVLASDRDLISAYSLRENTPDDVRELLETRYLQLFDLNLASEYLGISFTGQGGGGMNEWPQSNNLRSYVLKYSDLNEAEKLVEQWMRHSKLQRGPVRRQLLIVGSSRGSIPANELAQWFEKKYGQRISLLVMVEGVKLTAGFIPRPQNVMGPAERRYNFYGSRQRGILYGSEISMRDVVNQALDSDDHNVALFMGAQEAQKRIKVLLGVSPSLKLDSTVCVSQL